MSLKSATAANGIPPSVNVGCALALARHLVDAAAAADDDEDDSGGQLCPLGDNDPAAPLDHRQPKDDDDSCSHSSSLESFPRPCSPLPDHGQRAIDDCTAASTVSSFGSTTSCSVDSFELANVDDSSSSPQQQLNVSSSKPLEEDIDDSLMPVVDFEKIESCLRKAAEDRTMAERRRMVSEEVRRRLATDDWAEAADRVAAQTRTPLSSKLQMGNNLQVCFINDADLSAAASAGELDENCLQKSQSTPNFGVGLQAACTEMNHCTLSASQLRKLTEEADSADYASRQKRLESEALLLLTKAKQAARMQMEVERQSKRAATAASVNSLLKIGGLPLSGQKKFSRVQLTGMSATCLQIILNNLHTQIRELNDELVQLLVQKDALYMEQDSKLVDIVDLLQHQKHDSPCVENATGVVGSSKYEKILKLFRR